MKKLLLIFPLFAFCVTAQSQKESFFRVGFKGGVNLNKISGKSFSNEFNYNYQFGGFVQLNFTKKIGIQPELSFAQTTAQQSDDITDIYDDIFLGGDQKTARLDYLKFAGLLNIDLGPTQRIKLQFGPQWGMLVNEAVDGLKSSQDIFKNAELSAIGGIMIQLPLVHFGSRYELGLTNINGINEKDKWRSQALQFFIGVTF